MTKRKKEPTLEDVLARPWCYYCERDFDDVRVLHNHQKAKHFKCETCNKRMKTIGGLRVHLQQTHKSDLEHVENAIQGRDRLDVEIFGTEGIPEEARQVHNQLVTERYYQEHAVNSANGANARGDAPQHNAKKIKIETAEEIQLRLAAHKAKRAAELAAKNGTATTPVDLATEDGSARASQPSASPPAMSIATQQHNGASPMLQYHPAHALPQANLQQQPHNRPPPSHVQHPYGYAPPQQQMQFALHPPYGGPHPGMPYSPSPVQQMPHQLPQMFSPHGQYAGSPIMAMPGMPQPSVSPYHSHQQFTQPTHAGSPAPSTASSAAPLPQNGNAPVQSHLPALPPGLPQRPAFDAPPVSRSQLHELHYGQKTNANNGQHPPPQIQIPVAGVGTAPGAVHDTRIDMQDAQPVEHAGYSHAEQSSQTMAHPTMSTPPVQTSQSTQTNPSTHPTDPPQVNEHTPEPMPKVVSPPQVSHVAKVAQLEAGPGKKHKQTQRLVVTDHVTSAEERRAMLPRYAFIGSRA